MLSPCLGSESALLEGEQGGASGAELCWVLQHETTVKVESSRQVPYKMSRYNEKSFEQKRQNLNYTVPQVDSPLRKTES